MQYIFHIIATFCASNVLLHLSIFRFHLYWPYYFTAICTPLTLLLFSHFLLNYSHLPFDASWSVYFAPNFPFCNPWATSGLDGIPHVLLLVCTLVLTPTSDHRSESIFLLWCYCFLSHNSGRHTAARNFCVKSEKERCLLRVCAGFGTLWTSPRCILAHVRCKEFKTVQVYSNSSFSSFCLMFYFPKFAFTWPLHSSRYAIQMKS